MDNKNLQFVCPECGCKKLAQVQSIPTIFPILEIDIDGDFEYDLKNSKDAGGDIEVISHECLDCGFVISNEYGPITHLPLVADWIADNCPQQY